MTYYTGNWSKDVQDNLTERQSEKLFKKMFKIQDTPGLAIRSKENGHPLRWALMIMMTQKLLLVSNTL